MPQLNEEQRQSAASGAAQRQESQSKTKTVLPVRQAEDPGGEWQTAGDVTSVVGIGLVSTGNPYAAVVGAVAIGVGAALQWNANDQRRQHEEIYQAKYAKAVDQINKEKKLAAKAG